MDNKVGRPVETHISTVDVVEMDALPLVTSVAFGERHVSKMINLSLAGIVEPGFHSGFNPVPGDGLELIIVTEADALNLAVVNVNNVPLRIFQRHDVTLSLIPGVVNVVVLEGFYEEGTLTSQVSSDSGVPPARLRRLLRGEVTSEHIIVCEVDLTNNADYIDYSAIDTSKRTVCTSGMESKQTFNILDGSGNISLNMPNVVDLEGDIYLPDIQYNAICIFELFASDGGGSYPRIFSKSGRSIIVDGSPESYVDMDIGRLTFYNIRGHWTCQYPG